MTGKNDTGTVLILPRCSLYCHLCCLALTVTTGATVRMQIMQVQLVPRTSSTASSTVTVLLLTSGTTGTSTAALSHC